MRLLRTARPKMLCVAWKNRRQTGWIASTQDWNRTWQLLLRMFSRNRKQMGPKRGMQKFGCGISRTSNVNWPIKAHPCVKNAARLGQPSWRIIKVGIPPRVSKPCHPDRGRSPTTSASTAVEGPCAFATPPEIYFTYHSAARSRHSGFNCAMSQSFFSRRHRLICFSRSIALRTSSKLSQYTSRATLYRSENPSNT